MAYTWQTLSKKESEELLNQISTKQPYKMVGHSFRQSTFGKQYCSKCGLVALNNQISKWCIDKGCNYSDHSQYKNKVKTLTKQFN